VCCRLGRVRASLEWSCACEKLVAHDAQRVDVARRAGGLSEGLLGGEIPRRSEHGAGGRHAALRVVRDPGDAEVGDGEVVPLVEEEVRGLHVSMDDSEAVRVVEGLGRLQEPRVRRVGRHGLAEGPLPEGSSREVLHDDERANVPFTDVEDRDDVGVAREPRRRQRFPLEPLAEHFVARKAVVPCHHGRRGEALRIGPGEVLPERTHERS
jgi:hypothetical protein